MTRANFNNRAHDTAQQDSAGNPNQQTIDLGELVDHSTVRDGKSGFRSLAIFGSRQLSTKNNSNKDSDERTGRNSNCQRTDHPAQSDSASDRTKNGQDGGTNDRTDDR